MMREQFTLATEELEQWQWTQSVYVFLDSFTFYADIWSFYFIYSPLSYNAWLRGM